MIPTVFPNDAGVKKHPLVAKDRKVLPSLIHVLIFWEMYYFIPDMQLKIKCIFERGKTAEYLAEMIDRFTIGLKPGYCLWDY